MLLSKNIQKIFKPFTKKYSEDSYLEFYQKYSEEI